MTEQKGSGVGSVPRISVYAWYVLSVLFLVYVLNFIDRQILSILAQDIKASLGISDAQIGYLYGTAFAIFYSLFGIPLGRLADRWHRCRLIALGLSLWSGMTALSGFASSFGQLTLARVGVGIGEASASPAAFSLIGDYFPRERRALALSIYSAGLMVGVALSLPVGGSIAGAWNAHYPAAMAPFGLLGWQVGFLAVGFPGLLLAVWVWNLREPVRGLQESSIASPASVGVWREFWCEISAILPPLTLWSAARRPRGLRSNGLLLISVGAIAAALAGLTGDLLQWGTVAVGIYAVGSWMQQLKATDRPTFTLLFGTPAVVLALLSCGLLAFIAYAVAFWVPPYVIRTFHLTTDVVGWQLGFPGGLGAAVGCILGGRLSDAWKLRDPRGRIYVCMLCMLLPPTLVFVLLSTRDLHTVLLLYPIVMVLISLWTGSAAAMIQDCVLPTMRGVASASYLLASALLGLALSPYLVGKVSAVTGSLRTGVLSMYWVLPLALIIMWWAAKGLPAAERSREVRAAAFQ